jgi:hypothetical protein
VGIFYTSSQPVLPTLRDAIEDALRVDPLTLANPGQEAAGRTLQVAQVVSPQFSWPRFVAAVLIAATLLLVAIWTAKNGLSEISKSLMTSFTAFSGIVLGILGGETQKGV